MASNIPLGTFFQDGLRTGPLYTGKIPSSLVPFDPTLDLSYSSYSKNGPGILLSPQNTYNITPAPSSNANIVARTNALSDITHMPLTGDNSATKLISQSNIANYVQFDVPRVPYVTISTNNLTAPLRVTIFGFDYYENPLQHTYEVQNIGTYGLSVPAKAFFSVTQVSISGALTNGAFISVGASNRFGLPFVVNDAGDITSIGWGNSLELSDDSAELSTPATGIATLSGTPGTATVQLSAINTDESIIVVSRNTGAGTQGHLSAPIADMLDHTSFMIRSTGNETSTINWEVINPSGQYTSTGLNSGAMTADAGGSFVTIYTSQVQFDRNIQLSLNTFGTDHGQWWISDIDPGQSFTVTSTSTTETSTVSWAVMPKTIPQGTSNAIGSGGTAGQVFVNAPEVTATSNILLTYFSDPNANGGVLSAPTLLIQPGVGFTIVSSNVADTAQVQWAITNLTSANSGTATLVGGSVVVSTANVANSSVILLTYNTESGTLGTRILVSARTPGTSFTITSQSGTDTSTVNWALLSNNAILNPFVSPLGQFTPADPTFPVTATTGDVRGLYAPSDIPNGIKILRFTSYVSGADQGINQAANNQFLESALGQPVVGVTIDPLTPQDLYGDPQFYTGNNS